MLSFSIYGMFSVQRKHENGEGICASSNDRVSVHVLRVLRNMVYMGGVAGMYRGRFHPIVFV
jgi:hypothetical protein